MFILLYRLQTFSFLWASPLRLVSDRTVGKRVWELARSSEESWLDAEPGDLSPETTPPESPANAETGSRLLAAALVALAAVAAGADALLIETHNDPSRARCDGEQSVIEAQLAGILEQARQLRAVLSAAGS